MAYPTKVRSRRKGKLEVGIYLLLLKKSIDSRGLSTAYKIIPTKTSIRIKKLTHLPK